MQDIQSISGGATGGHRRLRFTGNHAFELTNVNSHLHGALKCPRCDSLNTKFCYYNNYNLSQPRHFCKSCRRYWTNGGVLRNVPVGGGCRKTKRSSSNAKSKRSQVSPSRLTSSSAPPPSKSYSSSESSTVTATTTAEAASSSLPTLNGVPLHRGTSGLDRPAASLFPEFYGLAAENCHSGLNFGAPCYMSQNPLPQQQSSLWEQPMPTEDRREDSGVGPLDWHGINQVDQSLFDLPAINTVDYWGNTTITGGAPLDYQNNIFLP